MEMFIMLALILANAIAILLVYQFIKRLPKMDKIIFIAASFGIAYVLVSFVYWISGFGIDDAVNQAAKTFITYVFVPVNIILLAPFIATKYNKWRTKEIENEEFIKRVIVVGIIAVVILVIECFYFRNIKQNIMNVQENMKSVELNGQEQNNEDEIIQRNGIYTNESTENITNGIYTNETGVNITNVEVVNETTNTVSKNVVESILNKNELE